MFGIGFDLWLLFLLTELALCFSPGPAVLFVASQGLRGDLRAVLWAAAGIVLGNTIYFLISALGLGSILLASPTMFNLLRWFGAAYLLWLAWQALRGSSGIISLRAAQSDLQGSVLLRNACLLQLANPKSLLFFVAILPQFINPEAPVGMQVLVLGITSQSAEILVLLFYGYFATKVKHWLHDPRFELWADRVVAFFLAVAALSVLGMRGL